jgi:peptidoglycan/xylan/chitin deacetylase (PgdA/CDA1 family)
MLRPALSRFHFVALLAAVPAALALLAHRFFLFGAIVLGVLVVMGLGVAIPQLQLFGSFVCRGANSRRCVALTFDDGPDPGSTPRLLEWLRQAQVKAAFFCVGARVQANPDLAARIVREGHLLENHSYEHSNWTNFFSTARLQTELARTQSVIEKAAGVPPRLFRPPMGLSNPRVFRAARAVGLTVVGWTARGLDTTLTEPEKIVDRIVRRLEPGAIILLHDGNIPAERLLATVKSLLDRLRALGYELARLDELLK